MNCYLCRDRGLVIWKENHKGCLYEYVGRCSCAAGLRFYGMPAAEDALSPFEIEEIEAENRKTEMENEGMKGAK